MSVVLVEYWVSDQRTTVFIGRHDLAEPHVLRVDVGREQLVGAVSNGPYTSWSPRPLDTAPTSCSRPTSTRRTCGSARS